MRYMNRICGWADGAANFIISCLHFWTLQVLLIILLLSIWQLIHVLTAPHLWLKNPKTAVQLNTSMKSLITFKNHKHLIQLNITSHSMCGYLFIYIIFQSHFCLLFSCWIFFPHFFFLGLLVHCLLSISTSIATPGMLSLSIYLIWPNHLVFNCTPLFQLSLPHSLFCLSRLIHLFFLEMYVVSLQSANCVYCFRHCK